MTTRTRALLAFAVLCFVWGSTYLAIKVGLESMPPFLFAGVRFLIAGSILAVVAYLRGERLPTAPGDARFLALTGLLLLVGGNGGVVYAEQFIASGQASVYVAMVPILMALVNTLIPGSTEPLTTRVMIGLAAGFAGTVLLVGVTPSELLGADWRGPIAVLLACASWAVGSVLQKRRGSVATPFVTSSLQMLASAVVFLAIAAVLGEPARWTPSWAVVWPMAYLVTFGSILAFTCYAYALRHLPASLVGTYAYVNPVVAVLLGYALLREPITFRMLVAMTVILGAVAWLQLSARSERKAEARRVAEAAG